MGNGVRDREEGDHTRGAQNPAVRQDVGAGRGVGAQERLMASPLSMTSEHVTSPGVSLEIEALKAFVAQRPWLADVLEREIHRLWGGRAEFDRPEKTGAPKGAIDPLAMAERDPPPRNARGCPPSRQ